MFLWKLLIDISFVAWYLPTISFRKNKYFLYFVVNSLVDPLYIALRYTFNLGMYNYIPLALFCEAMTLPLIDSRLRTISSAALLFIAFTVGRDGYLEFIICESVLALMVYYLLIDAFAEINKESAFRVFHPLLLIYFLRNGLMLYFYYCDHIFLISYYTLFLITTIILPILIANFGPEKKIFISKKIIELMAIVKDYKTEIPQQEFSYKGNGHRLTEREYEIFCLTKERKTSREISEQLSISKKTVENHRALIRQKLGVPPGMDLLEYINNTSITIT